MAVKRSASHARLVAVGGFAAGAVGIALQAIAGLTVRGLVPPGVVLLLAASVGVALVRGRALSVAIAVAGVAAAVVRFTAQPAALVGRYGVLAATGQWLLMLGIVAVLFAGASARRRLNGVPAPRRTRRVRDDGGKAVRAPEVVDINGGNAPGRRSQALQMAALLLLAPIAAEYLAAYDSSTGDAAALLGGLLIFVPLYGAPALIIREVSRRAGLGWTGMILIATAFGLVQAGIVDQSLFSDDYRGIESWADTFRSSYIEPLGISLHNLLNFVGGHVIYSICAPIAIAEALRPRTAREPWLGNVGLAIVAVLYGLASLLVLTDHLQNETSHASALQIAVSCVIVAALVGAAFRVGRRPRRTVTRAAPTIGRTSAVSLVLLVAYSLGPEDWIGALIAGCTLAIAAVLLARASRAQSWSMGHIVAIAAAALLMRGFFAFFYFPVIGEVSAVQKYGHNVVMLIIVAVTCYIAWRVTRSAESTGSPMSPPRYGAPAAVGADRQAAP